MTTLGLGSILFAAGCGHTHAATGAAQLSEAKPQQPEPSRRPERSPRDDGSVSSEELNALMKEHFAIAVWARNAVIDGVLEPIREPLRTLSEYGYETVPLAWMGGIERMQAAARTTSNAPTLADAASGIAALASVCGGCHLEQGHVVSFANDPAEAELPDADNVGARMSRHAWAVERLWDGLVYPSDVAWREGAAALAHAPMQAQKPKQPAPRDFARDFDELRALGARAHSATAPKARVEAYGKVLASCSRCHAAVDEHDLIRAQSVSEPPRTDLR